MSIFRLCSDDQFHFGDSDLSSGGDDRKQSRARERETLLGKLLSKMESTTQSFAIREHEEGIYSFDRERKGSGAGSAPLRLEAGCYSLAESAVHRNRGPVDVQSFDQTAAEPMQCPPNVAPRLKSSLRATAVAISVAFGITVAAFSTKVDTPSAPRFASLASTAGTPRLAAQSSIDAQDITFGIGSEDRNEDVAPVTASTADDQAFQSLSWSPFDPVMLEGGTFWSLLAEANDVTRDWQQHSVRDWSAGSQSPKQDTQSRPPFGTRTAASRLLAR
jgi:hypothetical protein